MGEVDLHLFAEGNHHQLYEKFGAQLRTIGDVEGVYFAVWAPNAQRLDLVWSAISKRLGWSRQS